MNEIEEILLDLAKRRTLAASLIVCFYTASRAPSFCAPMIRVPASAVGMAFGRDFSQVVGRALRENAATHDGAVMVGRPNTRTSYHVAGWSYRLYPPEGPLPGQANKGSAFNSCLAMSSVDLVDHMFLISAECVFKFERGEAHTIDAHGRLTAADSQ
jgi:hypothetical protein